MELQVKTGDPVGSRKGISPKQDNYNVITDYFNNKMVIGQYVEVDIADASKASIKKHVVPKLDLTTCSLKIQQVKDKDGKVVKLELYKRALKKDKAPAV